MNPIELSPWSTEGSDPSAEVTVVNANFESGITGTKIKPHAGRHAIDRTTASSKCSRWITLRAAMGIGTPGRNRAGSWWLHPVDPTNTPEARARNRRIGFTLTER